MKYDFSGYATRNDILCADGRTIKQNAFKEQDGKTIPLVWQHKHNEPDNVLGHGVLENRPDGVYIYGSFNDTEKGKTAKKLVHNGDVVALSIYATKLVQKVKDVVHGSIVEVSLVLSGANPGAYIDNLEIAHASGGSEIVQTEAFIYNNDETFECDVEHSADSSEDEVDVLLDSLTDAQLDALESFVEHGAMTDEIQAVINTLTDDQMVAVNAFLSHAMEDETDPEAVVDGDQTVGQIFETFTDIQKEAVYAMLGQALSTDGQNEPIQHSNEGGSDTMKKNLFDKSVDKAGAEAAKKTLTHDQVAALFAEAKRGGTLKEAFLAHAGDYGIDNIDYLFPDAQKLGAEPDFISRRMEWVASVLTKTKHTPFSRIKTVHADITAAEARAKGYIKGNEKVDEVFGLLKRVTTPATIYKKQKLDRDDILDITDLNVVAWLKGEMRVMLDEEIARAILIGDGRSVVSEDKIPEGNIRPVYTDADLYCYKLKIAKAASTLDIMDGIVRARKEYKGSGNPALYTTTDFVTDMLLLRDKNDNRMYKTVAEIAEFLRVSTIIEVEVFEGISRDTGAGVMYDLVGIIVNLADYNVGADKGGEIGMFDDFDIDFNQFKYLIETRISGALVKPKSAIVIEQAQV